MKVRLHSLLWVCLCSSVAWASAEAAGEASEPSVFSGTLGDALWTVVAFFVLLFALGKYAWGPLLATLNERRTQIEGQIKSAEEARRKAEAILGQSEQKGQELLKEILTQAQAQQKQLLAKAQDEVNALKRKTMQDIDNAQVTARQQMWKEVGAVVQELTSHVLGRQVTPEDNERLLHDAIAKIKTEGAGRGK